MSTNLKALEHYWLVAAYITFVPPGQKDAIQVGVNTVLSDKLNQVTAKQIGKAQQGLQLQIFKNYGPESRITDIFMVSMNYLGRMSGETFIEGVNADEETTLDV